MNDSERVELNELCSAAVDATLTDAQRARLQELLRESSEAREYYVRSMRLSASLHHYAAEMQSEPADLPNVIRGIQWGRWVGPLAAAAVVMVGLWLMRPSGPVEEKVESIDFVARITGERDCQWLGPDLSTGDELAAGQWLDLKSGHAELTFDSGAQLVVEGPVKMSIRSAWEAELQRGVVKANVPQEAVGFRVVNAAVEVVDLGTEFSIAANEDGATEVFVLKGAVEVHPKDAKGNRRPKAVLHERQAKRFARAGVGAGDIRDREEKFQKLMRKVAIDRIAKPLNYARWSFDEGDGNMAAVLASNGGATEMKIDPAARWRPGRFGSALEFNGTFALRADLLPPLRRGIRTVAFWTRIPEAAALANAGQVAAFPLQRGWGGWVELGWNRTPADGAFGALRLDAPAGTLVGSASLQDGRWHHVALVLGAPAKAPGRPPVKLYVDGRLENFSGKHPMRQSLERVKEDPELWLGGSPVSSERFYGMLDEVVIAEQPLTPQEIRHLMRSNALLSPEAIAGL
jgi:ferric-dicitrate binding protein FerR (iron transport regulator)